MTYKRQQVEDFRYQLEHLNLEFWKRRRETDLVWPIFAILKYIMEENSDYQQTQTQQQTQQRSPEYHHQQAAAE